MNYLNGIIAENNYNLEEEGKYASLLTTGNGYIGVRGSLEEFGSTKIQGFFVRGVFDEIVEIVQPFCDSIYMKKYYIDEQKLKDFEKQDSCINLADILLMRFEICGKVFYPWDGEILYWKRWFDTSDGVLRRVVEWQCDGKRTKFIFERFASFSDKHLYCQKATAIPLNHCEEVKVICGIDKKVRTNGQRIIREKSVFIDGDYITYNLSAGKKYDIGVKLQVKNSFGFSGERTQIDDNGIIAVVRANKGIKEYQAEKIIRIESNIDEDAGKTVSADDSYDKLYEEHLKVYSAAMDKISVNIKGNETLNTGVKFANYHTLITAPPDSVHSFSAKGLTGEKYNQFVWWDSEIYQLPIFTRLFPKISENALIYRYKMLNDARKNAEKEGCRGARFPFVCSIDGKEKVWVYARHPFLQVHITADIGYAVCDYYEFTDNKYFMEKYGMEMLCEITRYWLDRSAERDGKRVIDNVTGTDEHHPYVNNDAYTNYIVKYVVGKTLEYKRLFANNLTADETAEAEKFYTDIYLPYDKNGFVPQFDGYNSLSDTLEISGSGSSKDFQMKQSGAYHKSKIIKQPDVMMLYSYVPVGLSEQSFKINWTVYEKFCECSSSLTYPVHAICAARAGEKDKFFKYYSDTVFFDEKDIHNCAYQGVHSGCLAGGWYVICTGIFGLRLVNGGLSLNPVKFDFCDSVSINLTFKNKDYSLTLEGGKLTVKSIGNNKISVGGKEFLFKDAAVIDV